MNHSIVPCLAVVASFVLSGASSQAEMISGQSLGIDFSDGANTRGSGREKHFNILNGDVTAAAAIDSAGESIQGVTIDVHGAAKANAEMGDANLGFGDAGRGDYAGTPFSDLSFNDGLFATPANAIVVELRGLNSSVGYDVLVLSAGPITQNYPTTIAAGTQAVHTTYNATRPNGSLVPTKFTGVPTDESGVLKITIDSHTYCAANAIYVTATDVPAVPASPDSLARPIRPHYVPADKGLDRKWIEALVDRGERKIYRGDELLTIGMPCGGIAAGQLYVRGDGTLARWWIFNENNITDFRWNDPNTGYRTYRPASRLAQGFAVSACVQGGEPVTLELSERGFDGIGFIGEYPIATILYQGPVKQSFPLEVQGEVFSPIIPLNTRQSATPGTVLRYTLKNPTDKKVEVALGGWLQHAAMPNANDLTYAKRRCQSVRQNGLSAMVMDLLRPEPVATGPSEKRRVILFDDFELPVVRPDGTSIESGSLEKWTVEGNAFAWTSPKVADLGDQVRGAQGKHVIFSGADPKKTTGKLISMPFTIEERFIAFLIAGGRYPAGTLELCAAMDLIVDGQRVRTATGSERPNLALVCWDVSELVGKEAHFEIVDSTPRGVIAVDNIHFSNLKPEQGEVFPEADNEFGDMVLAALDANAALSTDWGSKEVFLASLGAASAKQDGEQVFSITAKPCSTVTSHLVLAPGETRSISFVITWYFPNFSRSRRSTPTEVGRMYSNWYSNSLDVAKFLAANHDRLYRETSEYRDALYLDTTLPYWFVQRSAMSSANLASDTVEWWKNGRFYSMEGVGFCLGTCGHVWNYSQSPSRLFPELERSVRVMQDYNPEYAFNATGRINFRGYRHSSESFDVWGYIPDAQAGYVLKAYREHLMSADSSYLDALWPRIKLAVQYLIERDGRDGPTNGIQEGLQHLTDSLGWGANSYTGSLYLAALRAAEQMALLQDDTDFAKTCHRLYEAGHAWTLANLWNGEYFIHQYSPAPKGGLPGDSQGRSYGDGCLADQVFGQNWAHQLDLGYIYPKDYVVQALQCVYKYNWTPDIATVYKVMIGRFILLAHEGEPGMVGITYPKGDSPPNRIGQNDDPWTGYEYQAASGMIWEGMLTEGLSIAYGVHQRYDGAKHNPWNEIEGGDHYSRSMSAWGMLLAASGYRYDGPAGKIGFAPGLNSDDFKCFFSAAEGWGSLSQKRSEQCQTNSIHVKWGKLHAKTFVFELPVGMAAKQVTLDVDGKPITGSFRQVGTCLVFELNDKRLAKAGETVEVVMRW